MKIFVRGLNVININSNKLQQFLDLKQYLPGSSVHGHSPGKNTGVGCHCLLQGIFLNQGLNPGLPHCRQILYHVSHQMVHTSPNKCLVKVAIKTIKKNNQNTNVIREIKARGEGGDRGGDGWMASPTG